MATATETQQQQQPVVIRESVATKIVRFLAHAGVPPPHLHRRALADPDTRPLLHLGHRPVGDRANRLVGSPLEPSLATFENYQEIFDNEQITTSIVT